MKVRIEQLQRDAVQHQLQNAELGRLLSLKDQQLAALNASMNDSGSVAINPDQLFALKCAYFYTLVQNRKLQGIDSALNLDAAALWEEIVEHNIDFSKWNSFLDLKAKEYYDSAQ